MQRLYLQIYGTVLAVLILWSLLGSLAWWLAEPLTENHLYEQIAEVLGEVLPGPDASRAELDAALERLGTRFRADLSLYGAGGALLGAFGEPVPAPPGHVLRDLTRWRYTGRGPTMSLRLPDGRWLVARHVHEHDAWHSAWLLLPLLLAVAVGIGAYPVVRRLTGRLERLQARVDALGAGELSARVQVEGRDEIAELAKSFNRAADRIERLVNAQKTMLASASHELRSPLARMRVAVELLAGDERPELRERIERDVGELDELIGELLLASRLDTLERLDRSEDVDLLALLAEEAARCDAAVSGPATTVRGDPRMLRRLVRNLLENARRYGGDRPVEASLERRDESVVLRVEDRGPGVPDADRERVFEAFYRLPGTRETTEGAGLGLALVRQIARHHGGEARCLPRGGGGTRFEVTLPVA